MLARPLNACGPGWLAVACQVYPNLDEYEQHEEKMIEDFNRNRDQNNAFMSATQQGIQNQMLQRRKKTRVMDRGTKSTQAASQPPPAPKLKRKSSGDSDAASQSNNNPAAKQTRTEFTEPETGDLVNFVLKRYPQCTAIRDLERTYLRTSCELKVRPWPVLLASCETQGSRAHPLFLPISLCTLVYPLPTAPPRLR